ncbi:dnaJ homolog subfamily C member 9-like [Ptychodera flava]|uniref:dnaJ homolog subfamily C member 9-like n=1 Tax=Ptychodera flava TaxID=63121 RepID=UPI00396A2756
MPALLQSCEESFGTTNLYDVLGVKKEASPNEVKRGYHRVSLKVHPDRVGFREKESATEKFQILGRVYAILSDTSKRALYDESGEVDDELDIDQDRDWGEYWRLLYQKVSVRDIKEFEEKYKGSDEELKDLKEVYLESKGDMDLIMDTVLCSTQEDEPRFRKILKHCIKTKQLPAFDSFTKESKSKQKARKKQADKEAMEAEEMQKELGIGDVGDQDALTALIKKKQQSRQAEADSFFASLEAKYAQPSKAKKSKTNGTSSKSQKKK